VSLSVFLPVLTTPYASPIQGLQRALDLAATLGAEVLASISEVDIPPLVTPALSLGIDVAQMTAQAEAMSKTRSNELEHHLRHQAERMSLPLRVERRQSRQEWVGETMAISARIHDLVVFCPGGSIDDEAVAEALIFGAGRPVVLIPELDAPVHVASVAVAWDGSRAAARALHDAMPLLRLAHDVVVLTAGHDKQIDQDLLGALLDRIGRSVAGVRHIEVPVRTGQSLGDALQQAAIEHGAGLLVMGGYGHSRMREFILGGATRSVLKQQKLAVLLSH
jgi:nucleotide-binding universal stress UspA family protein